ncbi:MAG: tetratricopeptide repeat protein [Pirellulales bacterium]|nr:tetratricopeptide repeat protein [Pirellulales bacterium]
MSLVIKSTIYGLVFSCVFLTVTGNLRAEDKGQEDLNLATESKLAAENFNDLAEVIRLCESAMEKGLDEGNMQFAKHLLAATLVQRAGLANKVIFRNGLPDPKWNDYRRLALADLEKAIKLVPEEPEALVMIAKLNFLPGGDKKRATETLDKAIAIEGGDIDIRATALVLRAGTRKDPKKRMADLEEALKISPQMVEALRARGFHYASMKKSEEALKDLRAAEEIDPDHPATVEAMALLLARMKMYDEALEKLDKLQKLQPQLITPLLLKAQIHAARLKKEEALKCLDQAVNLQPGNLEVLLLRAGLYDDMNMPEKAMADVNRVLELEPKQAKARQFRAILLARAGKMDEVETELKTILKKEPDNLAVQLQLGMIYGMQNKLQKSIEVYSNILAKNPNNVDSLVSRASAYLSLGDHAKSIADYEKALKLVPEHSGMLNNFAWVLATSPEDKLRDGKRAIELAKKACELTEYKQAHILSTLAAAYAESGNFKEALKWSKKAVELGNTDKNKEIQEALAKELKSYEKGKPWREKLSEKDHKKTEPPKPEAAKPQPKAPEKTQPKAPGKTQPKALEKTQPKAPEKTQPAKKSETAKKTEPPKKPAATKKPAASEKPKDEKKPQKAKPAEKVEKKGK